MCVGGSEVVWLRRHGDVANVTRLHPRATIIGLVCTSDLCIIGKLAFPLCMSL